MSVSSLRAPAHSFTEQFVQADQLANQYGTPLLVLDIDRVRENYLALHAALPGVTLHYALKPLPHADVVRALDALGGSFDLATNGEVDVVAQCAVPASKTIHTHPVKRVADIEHALAYGCNTFVFDCANELHKFAPYNHEVELLLRLSFLNEDAAADLSKKFGVTPAQALPLLHQAHSMGIRVRGLSFHVGSQTRDPHKYVAAIEQCKEVFELARRAGLPAMNTLDIGGGFPVSYQNDNIDIDSYCAPIREALAQWPQTTHFIAEPGRYIVASAMVHVMSVMGQSLRGGKPWYYMDDGVYGAFSGRVYGEPAQRFYTLHQAPEQPCVLAGPTCDSIDVITEHVNMAQLQDGERVFTANMGAYTWTTSTDFNFFAKAPVISVDSAVSMAQLG
ncbi:Lysine/ornithine decarboxylase [Pseudoalteromonas sp. THAF3]|uniref:type III PLP-dependent enzyme n=1 Tax=Pseudoalteromonas sp. THAF3 TaxID=2587843 RepID=UPI0012691568|nr:type III PLP-dependent enzyme [Pseudoalteromonas sp. THAF3]QFU05434.1 Lysine/ornithine decarboxylase [Pseudoalteromonas sp. THAF3]